MIRSRYRRIVLFFARVLLSFALWDLLLPRLALGRWARQTRPDRLRKSAVAFRALAIQMGGVLIKVGQFLSTRVDVLPVEITQELAGLQDEVPPASFEAIQALAEAELNAPLSEKFASFENIPMAAASLGQVHQARLFPAEGEAFGREVVVKVQRPQIELLIATDLAALNTVGRWLARYRPISRRANVPALLTEFTRILYEEVDYLAEGRNAETFAQNFQRQPQVHVPQVIWSHSTRRVLTLENVLAIKINDYEALESAQISRGEVASRLLQTYLKQIFEDGFFHADPHPGNLFVTPREAEAGAPSWQLTFVDFGMVGHVTPRIRQGLREMLIGVGTQDPDRVVRSYQTLGVLLPEADIALIQKAEARAFERFWGKNMSELRQITPQEIIEFTQEFRQLLYDVPFQIPHDLIFLGRAVGILSGICTGLEPDFNLWEHLVPYAQKMIAEEAPKGREFLYNEVSTLARSLLAVPKKMDKILSKMERGDIAVQAPEVTRQVNRLERALRGIALSIFFASMLLGAIQLHLAGEILLARILISGAAITLLWGLLSRRSP